MFRDGPGDNAVAEFCSGLTSFPNTPLGMLAAVSDFTLSHYVRNQLSSEGNALGSACFRLSTLAVWIKFFIHNQPVFVPRPTSFKTTG